jgi:hypothetical protein
MTDEKKPMKIEFAPGCFDQFDGTQEELDQMVTEIQKMFEDGDFKENSRLLTEDDLEDLDPEAIKQIMSVIENEELPDELKRKLQ